MLKFLIKLFFFCLPLFIYMAIPRFTHYIMDPDLEGKINSFLPEENNIELIIAGDSRAERQLIPALFEAEFEKPSVNIAKDVGDIISLLYANEKYNFMDSTKTFVMCISSLVTNNGVYKNWFMSQASITEMGLIKRILFFKGDYPENWYHRMGIIWKNIQINLHGISLDDDDVRLNNSGHLPIDKKFNIEKLLEIDLNEETTEHLWYRKPNNNGIKRQLFEESVKQLAETGAKIVFIQAPMSPTWRELTGNNFMHKLEADHSTLLKSLASQYDNVWSIDYYTDQPEIFTDEIFYNATHMHATGAQLFTKTVIDSMKVKSILN